MLLVKEEETLQDTIDMLVDVRKTYGMEIIIDKSKVIRLGSDEP